MKLFQKLLLVLVMVTMGSMEMKAADPLFVLTPSLDYSKGVKLTYQSVDANNNPVTLSEMIYFNKHYPNFKKIMISNHPTTTTDDIVPTGANPQIGEVRVMCDGEDRTLVVCPDYLGYGASKDKTHPYMCSMLTARNIVDGVLAAIDYVKTQKYEKHLIANGNKTGYFTFDSNYYTLNVGYSQGGAATLAVQKYLETEASDEVKKKINLKKSICGAGPHLQTYMFDVMEHGMDTETGEPYEMNYPLYLPYTIDGLMYTFGNSIMRGLKDEDIYTEKFRNSGLLQQIREKNTVAAEMNQAINEFFAGKGGKCTFYDIIRPEYADRNSKLYRTLHKALKQCDLLEGWKPQAPIQFYHWKSDEVVPYRESVMAYEKFKAMDCDVSITSAEDLGVASLWAIKKFDDGSHMGYGTKFYLSIFSGSLR